MGVNRAAEWNTKDRERTGLVTSPNPESQYEVTYRSLFSFFSLLQSVIKPDANSPAYSDNQVNS